GLLVRQRTLSVGGTAKVTPLRSALLVVVIALAEIRTRALGELGGARRGGVRQLGLLFLGRNHGLAHLVPPQSSRSYAGRVRNSSSSSESAMAAKSSFASSPASTSSTSWRTTFSSMRP